MKVVPVIKYGAALLVALLAIARVYPRAIGQESMSSAMSSVPSVTAQAKQAAPASPEQILRAVALARQKLQQQPGSAAAWLDLGKALEAGGDLSEAAAAFTKATDLDPQLSEAWMHSGRLAAGNEKWWLAADDFGRAAASAPKDASAHFLAANMLLRIGDFAKAKKQYETALHLEPALCCFCAGPNQTTDCGPAATFIYTGLGQVLTEQGDLPGAQLEFRRALDLRPDFPDALTGSGQILLLQHHPAGAGALFERALRTQPDSLAAHNGYAIALRQCGKQEKADQEFTEARKLFRQQHLHLRAEDESNRGLVLWQEGKLSAAAATLREAIADDPDYAPAHNNLGGVLDKMGDPEGAIREFAAAVRVEPGYAVANRNWGIVLLDHGQAEPAIEHFHAALKTRPGDAVGHFYLGLALNEKRKYNQAKKELRRAVELAPQMARAHVELGLILASSEGTVSGAARAELERGLQLDPKLRTLLPEPIRNQLGEKSSNPP
jgi:tetratricopeptide (TPR) repeat protein